MSAYDSQNLLDTSSVSGSRVVTVFVPLTKTTNPSGHHTVFEAFRVPSFSLALSIFSFPHTTSTTNPCFVFNLLMLHLISSSCRLFLISRTILGAHINLVHVNNHAGDKVVMVTMMVHFLTRMVEIVGDGRGKSVRCAFYFLI